MKQIFEIKEKVGRIKSPSDIFNKVKKVDIDYTQENFIIIFLNTKNEMITSEVLFKGGLNCCMVDPKTIFRKALLHNSNAIIIAHNHPSGGLEPSSEDKEIYNKLIDIGEILQLKVLDSIIFNENEYYAMRQ